MARSFPARLICGLAACASLSCTFGEKVIAPGAPQVAVHAVLDPGAPLQEILVEQVLTGVVQVNRKLRFDALDPINTGDGVPITGATVTITGPDGTLTALEHKYTNKPVGYGAGRYEMFTGGGLTQGTIRPGASYALSVRTLDGIVVTGSTVVPNVVPITPGTRIDPFDRDRDTLRLAWKPVAGARTYGLRVESPFGPFLIFSDTTHLQFPGDFRNLFASDFQHLFIPGFRQTSTVFAVDTNYFDYYRSHNDPFTGSGIINRLRGGIGLFGAVVLIDSHTVDVTQQPREPEFEGEYDLIEGPRMTPSPYASFIRLYVETAGPTFASLSGWYSRNPPTSTRDGIAGTRDGARIELQFQLNQDEKQTLARFIGSQVGDSLIGSYNGIAGRVVFRRRR